MSPAPPTPDVYTGPGFHFRFPAGWVIEEERRDDELTVTVGPDDDDGTASWSLTIMPDRPAVQATLRTILRTFEEEYSDLDAYPVEQEIAGCRAVGRDLEFMCLELTNTAGVRVFRTRDFTAVILFQATDIEWDACEPAFRMLTGSLSCGWEGIPGLHG